jgi:hypothetical protein
VEPHAFFELVLNLIGEVLGCLDDLLLGVIAATPAGSRGETALRSHPSTLAAVVECAIMLSLVSIQSSRSLGL